MRFNEYDTVRVLNDTEAGIKKGEIGAIIMVYDEPTEAYEVEFIDEGGIQKAQIVFLPYEIEKA